MNNQIEKDQELELKQMSKKRGLSIIILICVLVAVLLLNVAVSVLAYKKVLDIDLTRPKYSEVGGFYTFSDDFKAVMDQSVIPSVDKINTERAAKGLDAIKVEIIFCDDADILEADEQTKMIHHTARQLQSKYPNHIEIKHVNVEKDPSSVQEYKVTSSTSIYPTDVIVSFGTEFIVHGMIAFYTLDNDTGEVWAYNGEKKFAASILSLTRTDSPVCVLTTNHGESLFDYSGDTPKVKNEYSTFIEIIRGSGYEVEFIDLEKDEIPDACRMMICFAPTTDFKAFGSIGESGVSEIEKLDKYLDDAKAFFYICDQSTPTLTNLEEYLSEWGIKPARVTTAAGLDQNYSLFDNQNSANGDGSLLIGKYATSGYGASITADLRQGLYPPATAFGSSTAILWSDSYTKTPVILDENTLEKTYIYSYYNNGVSRTMYDIFTTNNTAYAKIGGEVYRHASDTNLFSLFTLTEETNQVQEDSFSMANLSSYVLALSSTEFLKNEFLDSKSYGNADVLLAALRATSTETVPVNLIFKTFYDAEINDTVFTFTNTTAITVALCSIPVSICLIAGVVVCIKRRFL